MEERAAKTKTEAGSGVRAPGRRRFLRRGLIGGAAILGAGTVCSVFGERTWLTLRRIDVPLADLPPALDSFTICHLTDLHRGPFISEGYVRRGAEMALALKPDLIAITGDLVSYTARYARSCASALSSLRAQHGVYAVLGNHEYWTGRVTEITRALERVGIRVLVNSSVRLDIADAEWWLAGVDDVWAGAPDLDGTLSGVPQEAFKILLCHAPDFADEAAKRNIPLQLSGHSHGGQVHLPRVGRVGRPYMGVKYPYGLQRVEGSDSRVYTSAGLGVTMVPIRLNCRPEVALLTLTREVS
jgi:predicted MPP superfamily phosphohydrolase